MPQLCFNSCFGSVACLVNTQILVSNLRQNFLTGGPAIVCSRWDQEVRETRHQIMAAARFLMKNDMMFVAEREVEIHIWKTVYYQVWIIVLLFCGKLCQMQGV